MPSLPVRKSLSLTRSAVGATLVGCWLFLCSLAVAVPPPAPEVLTVGKTISSSASKGFMCRWKDNSSDEDLFELRVKAGPHAQFVPVNYFLSNSQFGMWYANNRYLAAIPEGTVISFDVIACHATIVRDQASNQITDFTVTERSKPSNVKTVIYTRTTTDPVLYPPTAFTAALEVKDGVTSDGNLVLAWKDGSVIGTGANAVQTRSQVEDGFAFFVKDVTATAYPAEASFVLPFDLEEMTLPSYSVGTAPQVYGLLPGHTYRMKVRSMMNDGTNSDFSSEATLVMPAMKPPTNLVVTEINERSLLLTWDDNSDNEHGYIIQIVIGDPFGDITWDSVAANTHSYIVNNLVPGTAAKWKITGAYNPGNTDYIFSAPSNIVEHEIVIAAPTHLQATTSYDLATSQSITQLTWQDHAAIEMGYAVYQRRHGTTGDYILAKRFPANATSGSLSNDLLHGGDVDIVVRAVGVDSTDDIRGQSDDSNVVTITTKDGFTSVSSVAMGFNLPAAFAVTTTQLFVRTGLTIGNLPTGLNFNAATGDISGSPTQSGVFVCPLEATFADGWTARSSLSLRIAPPAAVAPTSSPRARTLNLTSPVTLSLDEVFEVSYLEQAVRVSTTLGTIDMVLYPSLTPETVTNFMKYVNNGDYAGSVFHRVSPGFVLQGGGYKLKTSPDVFDEVKRRPSPRNEPGIKNLQWTIAMAKGDDPNSATHDFFINLSDNTTLDTQNQGFTVFGRLADRLDVRTVVNNITAKPGLKAIDGDHPFQIKLNAATVAGTVQGELIPTANNPQPVSPVGGEDRWPVDVATTPSPVNTLTADLATKLITITSIAPTALMSFAIATPPDSAVATASLDATTGIVTFTGVANGNTSVIVRATDIDGRSTSETIPIIVNDLYVLPAITSPPTSLTTAVGTGATFTVSASGTNNAYQWRKGGVAIPGATNISLVLSSVTADSAGSFDVVVTNNASSVTSSVATLTVLAPVAIVTPPTSISRPYASSATFSVSVTGTSPTYQWRKNGTDIPTATAASYTRTNLVMADSGDSYDVVVTNGLGSVTSTPAAVLTVTRVDTDNDGLYDDDEVTRGLDRLLADFDHDGVSDGIEVLLGTDPKKASSKPADTFISHRDASAAIASIGLKRLIGGILPDGLNGGAPATVPDQWLGTHELTNEQFAALLHQAVRVLDIAEIVAFSGRRYIRYPKGNTGEILCYLSDSDNSIVPSCDISADSLGTSFIVAKAKLRQPVSAVSWFGGYLASVVMNDVQGYPGKTDPSTWTYNPSVKGWSLPAFTAWEWAARGGAAALTYPTGGSLTAKQANLANTSPSAAAKPIGSYPASLLGYYDLAGNVAEWVAEGDAFTSHTRGGGYSDALSSAHNVTGYTAPQKVLISRSNGLRLALIESASVIVSAPAHRFVSTRDPITLSVTATGAAPLRYQWQRNGKAIAGATSSTFTIPQAKLAHAGAYNVVITSGTSPATKVSSAIARVAVVDVPSTAPPKTFLKPNTGTAFTTHVAGAPGQTFTYRWSRSFGSIENDYTLHGVDKPTLRIISAQHGMSDAYLCAIIPSDQPAASPISVSFGMVVYELPGITPAAKLPYGIVGVPYSYQTPTESSSEPRSITKWTITGLPPGLSYSTLTGLISGTPTAAASQNVRITASNPFGSTVTASSTLVIRPLPANTASTWQGPVPRHALNNQLGGRLDFSVSLVGAITGKLQLGAITYPFTSKAVASVVADTGVVAAAVTAVIPIPRAGLPSLQLSLSLTPGTNAFTASLGELPTLPTPIAITGWRTICDLDVSATTEGRLGLHTLALAPPGDQTDPDLAPQGISVGSITIADNGTTTLVVQLADGSVATASGLLGPEHILCYVPLYGGQGSLVGTLRVRKDIDHTVRIAVTDSLTWLKKNLGSSSTERSYRAGFGPLVLTCLGGKKWSPPASGELLLGLADTTATLANNASLAFTSGGLAAPFNQPLRVTPKHATVFPAAAANPNKVSLTLQPKTGLISGKFTLPDGRVADYRGVIIPHPTLIGKGNAHGHFTLPGLTPTPAPVTIPLLSGRLDLTAL